MGRRGNVSRRRDANSFLSLLSFILWHIPSRYAFTRDRRGCKTQNNEQLAALVGNINFLQLAQPNKYPGVGESCTSSPKQKMQSEDDGFFALVEQLLNFFIIACVH